MGPAVRFQVHTSEGSGVSEPIDWGAAFNREHVVILEPPSGGYVLSVKTVKRRSMKQEKKRIEAIGGRRHSGSGSIAGYKSDGSTSRWRMENKFTTAESFRVELKDLRKIRSECQGFQAPVYNVEFQDKHTGQVKETWVLVPAKEWERLANAASASE